MTYWQETLRESVTTVDELIKRFGVDHIDQEAVQRAVDGFNLRITPEMLNLVKEPDGPIWRQYVPSPQENEVVDGIVDSLGRGRRFAGAEHHPPLPGSRPLPGEPGLRRLLSILYAAPQGG